MLPPDVPAQLAQYGSWSHHHDPGTVTCAHSAAAYLSPDISVISRLYPFGAELQDVFTKPLCVPLITRLLSVQSSCSATFSLLCLFPVYKPHYMDVCGFCQEWAEKISIVSVIAISARQQRYHRIILPLSIPFTHCL